MFTKKFLVSALMAAGLLGGAALPLPSIAAVDIYVNTAPPPPRHERVPDPGAVMCGPRATGIGRATGTCG